MPVAFRTALPFFLALTACGGSVVRADRVELVQGGQIDGIIQPAAPGESSQIVVRLASGALITIAADQIKAIERRSPAQDEYDRRAAGLHDAASEHWAMAEWCRQNELAELRQVHLRRVLELEPDHVGARHALGFSQLGGKWVQSEEFRKASGYQLYRGQWRLPQEIELLETRRRRDLAQKEMAARLRRLRAALDEPGRREETLEQWSGLDDAIAVKPLSDLLDREPVRAARILYVEVLGRIGLPAADALLKRSIEDLDEEVRFAAFAEVQKLRPPQAGKFYLDLLRNENNVRINRAAWALGELGDTSYIEPLMHALVTTHTITQTSGNANPDAVTTSFGSGGTSFAAGSSKKTFQVTAPNEEVLRALVKLSGGVSFNYDLAGWKRWLASRQQASQGPLRPRD